MRLLLICRGDPFATPAGTEIFVKNLAFELTRQNHEIDLLYEVGNKEEPPPEALNIKLHKLHLVRIPYLRAFDFRRKSLKAVMDLIVKSSIDAVIFFGAGTFAGHVFNRIKHIAKRPLLIYYAMDSMVKEYERTKIGLSDDALIHKSKAWVWYAFLIKSDRLSCREACLILASSKDTVNALTSLYGVPREKVRLLYEGVPNDFAEGIEVVDPDVPTFLHIGGGPRKGTRFFLEAMRLLKEKYGLRAKAVITRFNPIYLDQAKKMEIDIEIHEYLSSHKLKQAYASCTALVSPSLSEGFCLPIIEAAMFGKPAIVTRTGSLPELVNDGIDGYVAPVADVDSLAERMYELATNDELRSRMSIKAKEKAEKFKIRVVAKNFIPIISMTNRP